jgi:hypothetical protein
VVCNKNMHNNNPVCGCVINTQKKKDAIWFVTSVYYIIIIVLYVGGRYIDNSDICIKDREREVIGGSVVFVFVLEFIIILAFF